MTRAHRSMGYSFITYIVKINWWYKQPHVQSRCVIIVLCLSVLILRLFLFLFFCRGADRLSPVRLFFTCASFELIPALLPVVMN